MTTRKVSGGGGVSLARAMSVAGFLVVVLAVAVTSGPIGWASWRRAGLGWRFWSGLGTMGATLAVLALVVCLALAVGGRSRPKGRIHPIAVYALLSVLTLVLSWFVPAINAV